MQNDKPASLNLFFSTLGLINTFTIPVGIGMCLVATPFVQVVLGDGAGVACRVSDAGTDTPAQHDIVAALLDQLPRRTDRAKCPEPQYSQPPLRQDRRPPERRAEPAEIEQHPGQRPVHNPVDRPQRMLSPAPPRQSDGVEQTAAASVSSADREPANPRRAQPGDPQSRNSPVGSVIFKVGLSGLTITLAILIQQYWGDQAAVRASAGQHPAIATGLPADPPAPWAGLPPAALPPVRAAVPLAVHDPNANKSLTFPKR